MRWMFWRKKSRVEERTNRLLDMANDKRVRATAVTVAPMLIALAARVRSKTTEEKKP